MSKIDLRKAFIDFEQATDKCYATAPILNFMETEIHPDYRRGNGLYQYQLFLNGTWLEDAFIALNGTYLSFCENNHGTLGDQKRGNNIPDFEFTINKHRYTLDTKTNYYLSTFNSNVSGDIASFHTADFVIAFIMSESKFYYRERMHNSHGYLQAAPLDMDNLSPYLTSILGWIVLPHMIKMINFGIKREVPDKNIPTVVHYGVQQYTTRNNWQLMPVAVELDHVNIGVDVNA